MSGSELTLRPRSAAVIYALAWALGIFLFIDAVMKRGVDALVPHGVAIACALLIVHALLWAPRTVLRSDSVEIRNVFHTYRAHFSAIDQVTIGAMVSILARTASGRTRKITAWNAPGVGRDKPADAAIVAHPASAKGGNTEAGRAPRLGPEARLAKDQRATESWEIYERWDRWHAKRESAGEDGNSDTEVLEIKLNLLSVAVLGMLGIGIAALFVTAVF